MGNITAIDTENDEVIAYTRKDGNETIYCYFNFSQNKVFEPLNIKSKKLFLIILKK